MRALRLLGRAGVLVVLFVAPTAAFVKASGMVEQPVRPGAWHPTAPLIGFATEANVGWALRAHKPTPTQLRTLRLTGVLPYTPPATPLAPSLAAMPTTGWTLDNGAVISTDRNDILVLRPLSDGRPSLPGHGQGWRGAYWQPARTQHWQNYRVGVTVTNLGGQGSGGDATIVVGYAITRAGYAVSISAARITIQNPSGAHIYSAAIHAATRHRVVVKLTNQLTVSVDGTPIASFPVGRVHGGIGFGVWKPAVSSNLPFFTNLKVNQ